MRTEKELPRAIQQFKVCRQCKFPIIILNNKKKALGRDKWTKKRLEQSGIRKGEYVWIDLSCGQFMSQKRIEVKLNKAIKKFLLVGLRQKSARKIFKGRSWAFFPYFETLNLHI